MSESYSTSQARMQRVCEKPRDLRVAIAKARSVSPTPSRSQQSSITWSNWSRVGLEARSRAKVTRSRAAITWIVLTILMMPFAAPSERFRLAEYPILKHQTSSGFEEYEKDLKLWSWQYGNKSTWVIDQNVATRAAFQPPTAAERLQDQMTIFRALQHAFSHLHSEILRMCEDSFPADQNFATTAFTALRAQYRAQNFSTAQ